MIAKYGNVTVLLFLLKDWIKYTWKSCLNQ